MAGRGPFMCSRCTKKFPDEARVLDHIRDRHKGVGAVVTAPRKGKRREVSYLSATGGHPANEETRV